LYNNLLQGSIPSELGNLVHLEYLFLYGNWLDGTIPSELGNQVDLVALYLYDNSLGGSIPSELGNLLKLEVLCLNENSLMGTLPLSISNWSRLQSANLSTNMLSGDMSVFSTHFGYLEVLDLSLNRFTGTIPPTVLLPDLHSIILGENCFSGSLPPSICWNPVLRSVVMDVLTGNCGTRDSTVFQGTVLKKYVTGTIPSCIWNSSSIRTLHLLGNGLEGSLMDISNVSVLSVLALGSNQLTGTIPPTLQQRCFAQLDLSINRLSGTLISDLCVSEHTTVYDLSVNRLSGNIPGALYSYYPPGVINVLEGNLFGCQQNNIPPSDVSHSSYQCGSVNLQYSLIAWGAGFILCAATVFIATIGSDGVIRIASVRNSSREMIGILTGPVCSLAVCIAGLVGFVLMKMCCGEARDTPTFAIQYWWTSTIAFMHNWVVSSFLFLVLAIICTVFTISAILLSRKMDSEKETDFLSIPTALCVFTHLINVVVIAVVNGVYVLAAIGKVNSSVLLVFQTVLGLFKLSWSSWVIPWLLSRAKIADTHQVCHRLFMVLFVFLGGPFASSFSESSSCFLYVLTKPALISFSLLTPVIYYESECDGLGCSESATTGYQLVNSSVTAPWIYSYQCSSAVITSYAPVLILSYLMSGIIIPCSVLMVAIFPACLPGVVKKTMSVFDFIYLDKVTAGELLSKKSVSKHGRKNVVKHILNFGVLMTFGLAVPLLAVAIMFDTVFNPMVTLLLLERFSELCQRNGLDPGNLSSEFWNSFTLSTGEVSSIVYIVLGYVSIFWSLFAFDWIADMYGLLAGGLTMLLPLVIPTTIGFCLLRWCRRGEQADIRRQETSTIELCETGNPVILPQTTNDDFNACDK
jgi:hypothetical protein